MSSIFILFWLSTHKIPNDHHNEYRSRNGTLPCSSRPAVVRCRSPCILFQAIASLALYATNGATRFFGGSDRARPYTTAIRQHQPQEYNSSGCQVLPSQRVRVSPVPTLRAQARRAQLLRRSLCAND